MRAAAITTRIGSFFALEMEPDELFFALFDKPSIAAMAAAITEMKN
jgi:hypothetical protein